MGAWYRTARPRAASPEDVLGLGYERVSTKKQDRGFSPEAQRAEIVAYVDRQGWKLGEVFRDTLQGTRTDRAGYQRMLAEVRRLRKTGRAVAVVAAALDRTGRDEAELHAMRKELKALDVELHYTREGGAITDDEATIKGLIARKETEKIRERVKASKVLVASKGLPPSGPAPWGYRWRLPTEDEVPAGQAVRRILEEHPAEAPYVREAFARIASGETLGAVLLWVTELPDVARGGRRLGQFPLRHVLRNPIYVRRYVGRGSSGLTPEGVLELPQGRWPRLVDDAAWLAAQRTMDARSIPGRPPSGDYVLTGYLRCARCGSRMVGDRNGKQVRYRCSSHTRGAPAAGTAERKCSTKVDAPKAEAAVFARIGALMAALRERGEEDGVPALERAWEAARRPDAPAPDAARLAGLDREAARLRNRITKAQEAFFDGDVTREERDAVVEKNRAALAALEAERAALAPAPQASEDDLPGWDVVFHRVDGWTAVVLQDAEGRPVVDERRTLLTELVRSATVSRPGPGLRSPYLATVEWTPMGEALHRAAGLEAASG